MMKNFLLLVLLGFLMFFPCCKNHSGKTYTKLQEGFKIPPLEARPRALWAWVDGNFELSEITHEMEEAKRMGLGGFMKDIPTNEYPLINSGISGEISLLEYLSNPDSER